MENTTMRMLINSDDRKVDSDIRKIPLSNLANRKNPFGAAVEAVELVSPIQHEIVRNALLKIPIPNMYVHCAPDGTYTFIKGKEYAATLLGALEVANAERDVYYARRLEELTITIVRFYPGMSIEHCREIVRRITEF